MSGVNISPYYFPSLYYEETAAELLWLERFWLNPNRVSIPLIRTRSVYSTCK